MCVYPLIVFEWKHHVKGWTSPRLGIRFESQPDTLLICYPDGRPFLTSIELDQRANMERQRADQAAQRAEKECQRAEKLAECLRGLGQDPNEL